jgi:membrane-bound lytic murein transglycosylase F
VDASTPEPVAPVGLAALRRAGVLRALVGGSEGPVIPRAEDGAALDRARAEALARHLGLEVRFVVVPEEGQLVGWLRRGEGDLIATPLADLEAEPGLALSPPLGQARPAGPREEPARLRLAVRAEDADLWAEAGSLLAQFQLTRHLHLRASGDLTEIRGRGALRVGMLNNALAYFIYRGQEVGFQFELAELLCLQLGLRLQVVVPERPGGLWDLVQEGRADLAFVSLREGDPRQAAFLLSPPIDRADHLLVQPAGQAPLARLEELAGRSVHARRSSVYFPRLEELAGRLPGLRVVVAPEELATQELVRQVGRGEIPLTVANAALLGAELSYRDDIQGSLVLAPGHPLALVARADSPRLAAATARFLVRELPSERFAALRDRYFEPRERMREVRSQALDATGAISPYDALVKRAAAEHGLDWRLVLAQMYQESQFDPRARSWAGARGLMQLMPRTAVELGVKDPWDPEENVRAGVAYLARLRERFEPELHPRHRLRFALAAYNAGLEHVRDARRLARARGLDPDRWFGHVERAILLLENPVYHRRARYGYCRGSEPVQYVSRIQTKYDAFSRLAPASPP